MKATHTITLTWTMDYHPLAAKPSELDWEEALYHIAGPVTGVEVTSSSTTLTMTPAEILSDADLVVVNGTQVATPHLQDGYVVLTFSDDSKLTLASTPCTVSADGQKFDALDLDGRTWWLQVFKKKEF